MLSCVWASCLEETNHTTETHAKQNPWLALWCGHHAFASLHSVGPVPAFYKCPIWQELCPAVSLKVLVQIPSSNVNPIQILNDPNDAFQIVSSHITFRGNRGLCFINSTGNRWRKSGKSYAQPRFTFIVTHYSTFCSLISASLSLCHVRRIGMELQHNSVHGGFSRYSEARCVKPQLLQKSNYSWMFSFISISMQRFEIWPSSQYHLYLHPPSCRPTISTKE